MDPREKIAQLRRIAMASPDDALTHYLLGLELLHVGEWADSVAALRHATRLNPTHTAAWRFLGDAYRKSGDTIQAGVAYQQCLQVSEATGDLQTGKEVRALIGAMERTNRKTEMPGTSES